MWPNRQETARLVTFTEEILIGKFHFVRSVTSLSLLKKSSLQKKLVNIDFEHDFQAVSFSFFEPNHFYKNNSSKKTQCIQNKYKKKKEEMSDSTSVRSDRSRYFFCFFCRHCR